MNKFTFALVLLVAVLIVAQSVQAKGKAKKKAPVPVKDTPLSDKEHFHDGKHDPEYDHDAFLGEEQASEMKKRSPKETKKRLKSIFAKMDVDGDKKLSRKELIEWIVDNMKKHVAQSTVERMKELDKNKDGKVSWEEYEKDEYSEDGDQDKKLVEEMKTRDAQRFKIADSDDDGLLDQEELGLFIHPEESARMTSLLVQENVDTLDKDGDGKVNFDEYLQTGEAEDEPMKDKETINSLKENFNNDLDKNHDGVLDNEEIKHWILPGGEVDPATGEADHLMKETDMNKDNYLSLDEILKHYELFSGSRATAYGELLKKEL